MKDQTDLGLHFAMLAQLAYADQGKGIPAYKELGYHTVQFVDVKNAQCYLLENDDDVVVVFRGTELDESKDVKADLKFQKKKLANKLTIR